jgi:hypothetical protein
MVALSELQVLVDDLAQRLGAPAVLEDHEQRMIVYSSHDGPVDEVRRDSIMRRETRAEVRGWFRQFGIAGASTPVRIPSHPELGILGRLCVPVRFRRRLMGFLFLIDDAQRIGEAQALQAAEHAGVLLYEEELAQRLSASILSSLLGPSAEIRESAAQQLTEQGLAAAGMAHAVVYLRTADLGAPGLPEIIGEVLWELGRRQKHAGLLRVARQDHAVLVVRDDRAPAEAAAETREMLAARLPGQRVVAGVGDPRRHLTAVAGSYRQALLAARVAAAVPSVGEVASWSVLGAYRALVQLPPGERGDSCLDPRLGLLLAAGPDLARTVETYLDLGGDAGRTAERLSVHRATLYYRLNKAQQVTGANLRDGDDRLALHLSFKLARLIERYPQS